MDEPPLERQHPAKLTFHIPLLPFFNTLHYYIHIPFCVSRCAYCDFFSTTLLERREDYTDALLQEINMRRNGDASTVYFGGGTPSVMSPQAIGRILSAIPTDKRNTEITLEANPGDLTIEKLQALRQAGINRLSIGIQSFQDSLLQIIGRRHNARQALQAVHAAQAAGFDNISIDLIYGLPQQTIRQWEEDIETALGLNVQHISCYCLSYEQGTRLTQQLEKGEVQEQEEDTLNQMYNLLCDRLAQAGFEHYEVSNFALPDFRSRHNSSYWTDESYIGIGAGAHSYNARQRIRSWNVCDINQYIDATGRGIRPYEQETLTDEQYRMERIMLGLRTSEGIEKKLVSGTPSSPFALSKTAHSIPRSQARLQDYLLQGLLCDSGTRYVLTRAGIRLLNRIVEDIV